MYDVLISRLHRYTENFVAYKLDADFASAVQEAADAIEELQKRVPKTPHGRLIDADALIADLRRQCKEVFKTDAVSPDDFWITRNQAYNERLWTTWCESLFDYLKTAPTIIEAEESE